MLDEKKVMNDKLLGVSLFGIAAGFVLGIGLTLVAIAIFTKSAGFGVIGGLTIVLASAIGHLGDRVRKQVADYIKAPYTIQREDDNEETT